MQSSLVGTAVPLSKVDRLFAFFERRWRLTLVVVLCLLGLALIFQDSVVDALKHRKPLFEVITFVLTPFISAAGFYLGYRSKLDMAKAAERQKEEARKLGALEEKLNAAAASARVQKEEMNRVGWELERREIVIRQQNDRIEQLSNQSENIWRLRQVEPFPEYRDWFERTDRPRVLTIANFKGGVGKTTLASLLGSYVSDKLQKPVLYIDLDYQGSLTSLMLLGCGMRDSESRSHRLFEFDSASNVLEANRIRLEMAGGQADLLPANYDFIKAESDEFFKYVKGDGPTDTRFAFARHLLHPDLARRYGAIIVDTPPRLSFGVINALAASDAVVVPTVLDKLSTNAVDRFVNQVGALREDLKLRLRFGGIVGTMARTHPPDKTAKLIWDSLQDEFDVVWGERADFRLGLLPRRTAISDAFGERLPYNDRNVKDLVDQIGERLFDRLKTPVQ